MILAAIHHGDMPKRPRKGRTVVLPGDKPLQIGPILNALGASRKAVAKAAKISAPYLTQLCEGERDNPSGAVLRRIGAAIGLTVDQLYEPPPSPEFIEEAKKTDPALLALLLKRKE